VNRSLGVRCTKDEGREPSARRALCSRQSITYPLPLCLFVYTLDWDLPLHSTHIIYAYLRVALYLYLFLILVIAQPRTISIANMKEIPLSTSRCYSSLSLGVGRRVTRMAQTRSARAARRSPRALCLRVPRLCTPHAHIHSILVYTRIRLVVSYLASRFRVFISGRARRPRAQRVAFRYRRVKPHRHPRRDAAPIKQENTTKMVLADIYTFM